MTAIYVSLAALFISYHGYRWFTSKQYPAPVATSWTPDPDAPSVSFLVPAWNAAKDITRFVASYEALSYPSKELALCAGGIDGSFEVANTHASEAVKVLEQLPGEGKQMALHKSIPASCGELIYLTYIDCRRIDDGVNSLLAQLVDNGSDVVTGSSRPLNNQINDPFVLTPWAADQVTHPKAIGKTTGILGRNAVLSRVATEASGKFTTPAPSGRDYTLAKKVLRAGLDIKAVHQHGPHGTIGDGRFFPDTQRSRSRGIERQPKTSLRSWIASWTPMARGLRCSTMAAGPHGPLAGWPGSAAS